MSSTESQKPARDSFDMPENHLDVVVTPGSVDPSRKASLRTTLIAVISMPAFFLLAFTLCYVSATHAPLPHDMALTVAGPTSVTEQLADAIDEEAPGGFDITLTTNAAAARDAVVERDAVGAVIVDGDNVTTVVASGGGRLAVATVTSVGQQVAASLGGTSAVEDVAPLPSDDPGGSILFFLLVICTVGAFLSVTGITQAFRGASVKAMVATSVGAALVVPVLGFAMISVYVDFEVTFGTVAALLGIGAIYTLAVGLLATLLTEVVGHASIFGVILVLIAFNFPSSGGSVPESMLPPFWQVVHNGWIGSGAFESMRSVVYFDAAGGGRWLIQLLVWLFVVAVLLVVVTASKKRRAAAELAAAPAVDPNSAAAATTTTPASQQVVATAGVM
jgi:hypothetical protein